jgi:hypothetical protein
MSDALDEYLYDMAHVWEDDGYPFTVEDALVDAERGHFADYRWN